MSIEVKISNELIPYRKAMDALQKRVEAIKSGKESDFLWILEHPTTFTGGIRSHDKDILDKTINVISTDRGGKVTLHNPEQKVIYFAIDLNKRTKDIRKLINSIEKSIIDFLKIHKIVAVSDKKNIGIWVGRKKIAAIGVRVSRWIAYHGCSININNNLKNYKKIIPCGLDSNNITSIYNEKNILIKNVNNDLKEIFLKNLNKI